MKWDATVIGLAVSATLLFALVVRQVVRWRRGHRVWDASGGLRDSRELVDVIDDTPVLVWTTDRKLRLTGSIGGGLHLLGLPTDQVRDMPLEAFFHELGVDLGEAHRRALRGETNACAFGHARHQFRGVVRPLRTGGRIVGVVGMATEELGRDQRPLIVDLAKEGERSRAGKAS